MIRNFHYYLIGIFGELLNKKGHKYSAGNGLRPGRDVIYDARAFKLHAPFAVNLLFYRSNSD